MFKIKLKLNIFIQKWLNFIVNLLNKYNYQMNTRKSRGNSQYQPSLNRSFRIGGSLA